MPARIRKIKTSPLIATLPMLDKEKLLESVFRINAYMTNQPNLDEILSKILDEVVDTIGFDRAIIRLFDETKRYLITKVVKNYSPEEADRAFAVTLDTHRHDCLAVKVAKSGQYLAIEDAANDPRITETDRMLTKISYRGSIFCAPLKTGDEVIGTLAAWCREETKFFPEQISLFQTFASQISIMIHNARLFEANSEKIRQLIVLQEAVSEMNSSYVLDNRILEILSQGALKIAKAECVTVCFLDMEKDRCFIYDGKEVFIGDKVACYNKIEQSIIKQAIDINTNIIRETSSDHSEYLPLFPDYPSEIAIPLHIKDKFKGALYLAKKSGGYMSDQINILDILAKNAATSYDNAIMHSELSLEARTLKTEVAELKKREDILLGFHDILGQSKKMTDIFRVIENVAGHNTNILIQGESGTGKELIARAIHKQSNRQSKHFVDVNCAAIPGTLLESELFGYEAGAFTDARKRKVGLLEYASGGTMLLDEIGDMSIQLQAKFLRVLEDGYIRRLGGTENIPIDVRFIFSTNKDITQMAAEGSFREDLFYRISVVPILIPSLRERPDDIILLARYYVDEFNKKFMKRVKGFSGEAEHILKNYSWPGNVRELKNIIERVMILKRTGTTITPDLFPVEMKSSINHGHVGIQMIPSIPRFSSEGVNYEEATVKIIGDIKHRILNNALEVSRGNKTKAAKMLNISRYKFIREFNKTANHSK
jgi:transcriptional regulator with GAF, ATPase, and Fis domain